MSYAYTQIILSTLQVASFTSTKVCFPDIKSAQFPLPSLNCAFLRPLEFQAIVNLFTPLWSETEKSTFHPGIRQNETNRANNDVNCRTVL